MKIIRKLYFFFKPPMRSWSFFLLSVTEWQICHCDTMIKNEWKTDDAKVCNKKRRQKGQSSELKEWTRFIFLKMLEIASL